MKRTLKKAVALVLVLVLTMSLGVSAFASHGTEFISQSKSDIPIIRISGDGEQLVDENGNKVFHYKDFASILDSDDEEDAEGEEDNAMLEATANILMPFLIDGLLTDNWEPYYENLQNEISDLFENSLLDKDGNAQYGTGLRPERKEYIEKIRHNDQAWRTSDGQKYYIQDRYYWRYDWRLDPIETAAEFKLFIDDVLASTGCSEVGIIATCLGTNVVTAYLALYPEHAAKHVRGVAYDGSVVGGAEMLSEAISGKFNIDAAAINRTLIDCGAIGMFDMDGFINTTLEMLDRTGVLDAVLGVTKEWIYYKLVEGVTSALALSTFYTWPNYWACVSPEDYDTAIEYVFGDENSAKRTEYAGLIEKLDNYNTLVRQRVPEILTQAKESGINIGIISKYGFQTLPICETNYLVSDQFASVKRSSFGATTGTIYEDLSDEYIAERTEAGYGKYISPDKQIDASTCLFPDSTWFIKGSSHSNWSDWELRLLYEIVSSEEQMTIYDSCWPSQFVVYSYDNDEDATWGSIEAMTTENCDTENWEAEERLDNPKDMYGKLFVAVSSLIEWLLELMRKVFKIG
ncbi:MAG: hypothetical protein IKY78_02335 [Clostridia bacterium]|nr:hypothetical protein [Clostridia bacterium]